MNKIDHIRICLNLDGTVAYFPHNYETDDFEDSLEPTIAIKMITEQKMPIAIAAPDVNCNHSNYESLHLCTLKRI
jgi:hypothetical protein